VPLHASGEEAGQTMGAGDECGEEVCVVACSEVADGVVECVDGGSAELGLTADEAEIPEFLVDEGG